MNKHTVLLIAGLLVLPAQNAMDISPAEAGALKKSVSRAIARKTAQKTSHKAIRNKSSKQAYKNILHRDAARDRKTTVRPLQKSRTVRRYTSSKQARLEQTRGVSPKTHMTSRIPKGRPISAGKAKERYGLREKPEVRMTVRVPKGQPLKKNKVIGGKAGYGEWTSTKTIPKENILKVKKIR